MKTKLMLVSLLGALCLTLPASALADDANLDKGWNTDWGMLFNLNNIFQNPTFLGAYGGGIGIQKNLDPMDGVRVSISFNRSSNPPYITQNSVTTTNGSTTTTTTTKTITIPSITSSYSFNIGASYLHRLSTAAISPYVGGGLSLGLNNSAQDYTDNVSTPNVTVTSDTSTTGFGLGIQGRVGLEWRVTNMLAIFAEYGLGIDLIDSSSTNGKMTVVDSAVTPAQTTTSNSSSSQSSSFNVSTGLFQGGALGLVGYF